VTPRRALDPELAILGGRDLVGLCGRLLRERSWETLATLFSAVGGEDGLGHVSLSDIDAAARLVARALGEMPPPRNPGSALADELRALRLAAAGALLARTERPPVGELERGALERAAALLGDAGDHRRAALTWEDLGDDMHAAEAWGALGDLDRMEAALEREERRSSGRRAAADAMRRFETLLTGGERRAALAEVARIASAEELASARELAAHIDTRLCRGRAVTLRAAGGAWVRVASLPATLGRDRAVEIPLRDPSVSRRHAVLSARPDGITVEDAGSRGGVRIGGVPIAAPIRLGGSGELALGASALLRFSATDRSVLLEGAAGLDRALRAVVGVEPISLAPIFPEAEGLALAFSGGGARLLRRADVAARVDGQFIGPGCDLLHGDAVEIDGPSPLRIEVE
jgi:hypothetical protein